MLRDIDLRDKKLVWCISLVCAIALVSGTIILPVATGVSYAGSFSILPVSTSSNTMASNLQLISHRESLVDPPLLAPAVASPISSSSPSNIQITAGKVQQISFNINTNNAVGGPFMVPSVLTNLAVTLASQNTSVRILGPSSWSLPSIPSSGKILTTDVFASTSLISSPVFFTVSIQYIQNNHDVKSASFNLGAIVVGSIQLSANSLGIRYIGNTPNLVGNVLNEGNTPAQFASVEIVKQPNDQFPSTSSRQLSSILLPTSSQYLGNIAVNSPVPFNIPLQAISSPQAQNLNNPSSVPSGRTFTPAFAKTVLEQPNAANLTGISNTPFPGIYPVSIRVTYVDDLKNTRQAIINGSVNVPNTQLGSTAPANTDSNNIQGGNNLPAQLDSQFSSTNGFVDAYWASNTARVTNGNGTISSSSLQATPVPVQQEVGPGDGQSILAVELTNTEFSTINGITAYLTLPPGFSSTTGGLVPGIVSTTSTPASPNQAQQIHQQQIAVATYNNVVTAGQVYTIYFKVNVDKSATLGRHLASLTLYYFRVPELQPGLYRTQNFAVPFILPGKVILDTVPTTTSLNPGVSNVAKILLTNMGTATAHGVVATITSITGNSISSNAGSSTTSSSSSGSGTNSTTTTPGAQITTITPPSTIPTVNIGARTFNIGTIPANGRAEINPIIYPSYSSGGTLQNLNLQLTYTNSVGQALSSSSSVGFLVQPTPPQAGITINPFAGTTVSPSPSTGKSNNSNSVMPNSTSIGKATNSTSVTSTNSLTTHSSRQLSSGVNSTKPANPVVSHSNQGPANNLSSKNPSLNQKHSSNSTSGISVSPASFDASLVPKAFAYDGALKNNNNSGVSHAAQSNKHGFLGVADTAYSQKQDPPAATPGVRRGTAESINQQQQANSSSLILVAGNTENMQFSVSNNNDLPITNAVISIASETAGLKIVGDTLWSLPSMAPHTTHIFATKTFASTTLIAQPVSFLVTMQYISQGQSQIGSFTLGGTVIGSIKVSANGIGINYIAGVPNLVGNLLNEGNTIGLYTTVQLTNQPFPANGTAGTGQQQQHHHGQAGANSPGNTQDASSSADVSRTNSPQSSLPPPQYLGDLQPDSPLPFSIPLNVNVNNTAPGVYPVKLQVTYSDDLKNSHTIYLNNSVQIVPQPTQERTGQSGGILGLLTGAGGGHAGGGHRGGGGGGSRGLLGLPLLFWIVIIAIIIIVLLYIRRRRKRSRAAFLAATTTVPDEAGPSEDIESLIDGSHKSLDPKKEE
jgi:hypothetical protein